MFEGLKNRIIKSLGGYTAEEFLHHCMIAPGDSVDKRIRSFVQIIRFQQDEIKRQQSKFDALNLEAEHLRRVLEARRNEDFCGGK